MNLYRSSRIIDAIVICSVLVAIPGCSEKAITIDDARKQVVGLTVDELYKKWGKPDRSLGGHKTTLYYDTKNVINPETRLRVGFVAIDISNGRVSDIRFW